MGDSFLSDVHIYSDNKSQQNVDDELDKMTLEFEIVHSRFVFSILPSHEDLTNVSSATDEDGDLILARKKRTKEVLNIYHAMATPIQFVGLQVWRGALLLADYLLFAGEKILKDIVILELGAGTGLCSIIASLAARHVFVTDTGNLLLTLCKKNCSINRHICSNGHLAPIVTRELNWKESTLFDPTGKLYGWLPEDEEMILQCRILLAADVIYDNTISDAFLNTVQQINRVIPGTTLYLAVEKRLNFTLDDLDVASPAYSYFFKTLAKHEFVKSFHKMPLTFPQSFQYERVLQLELWKIEFLKN